MFLHEHKTCRLVMSLCVPPIFNVITSFRLASFFNWNSGVSEIGEPMRFGRLAWDDSTRVDLPLGWFFFPSDGNWADAATLTPWLWDLETFSAFEFLAFVSFLGVFSAGFVANYIFLVFSASTFSFYLVSCSVKICVFCSCSFSDANWYCYSTNM